MKTKPETIRRVVAKIKTLHKTRPDLVTSEDVQEIDTNTTVVLRRVWDNIQHAPYEEDLGLD